MESLQFSWSNANLDGCLPFGIKGTLIPNSATCTDSMFLGQKYILLKLELALKSSYGSWTNELVHFRLHVHSKLTVERITVNPIPGFSGVGSKGAEYIF